MIFQPIAEIHVDVREIAKRERTISPHQVSAPSHSRQALLLRRFQVFFPVSGCSCESNEIAQHKWALTLGTFDSLLFFLAPHGTCGRQENDDPALIVRKEQGTKVQWSYDQRYMRWELGMLCRKPRCILSHIAWPRFGITLIYWFKKKQKKNLQRFRKLNRNSWVWFGVTTSDSIELNLNLYSRPVHENYIMLVGHISPPLSRKRVFLSD